MRKLMEEGGGVYLKQVADEEFENQKRVADAAHGVVEEGWI